MEKMFDQWLADSGVEIEAMIFRSPQDWCPDHYIFRFRSRDAAWSGAHMVPWGMDTFARAADIIREAKP